MPGHRNLLLWLERKPEKVRSTVKIKSIEAIHGKIMSHITTKSGYQTLVERLNKFPLGVVESETLYRILQTLVTEKEALMLSLLPIKPFNTEKAAQLWKCDISEARSILNDLCDKTMLVDIETSGEPEYVLPPPMAGFIEFSLMRLGNDRNQKRLAELYYQYMNVEEDFVKKLFTVGDTKLGRAFVNEQVIAGDDTLQVLDYERASEVINSAEHMAISTCYCRHKMMHAAKACDAPLDICMTFNSSAYSLVKHGSARAVDKSEMFSLLEKAYEHNLVQFGENQQNRVNFICNCCGCCCEAMQAQKRFAFLNSISTTNFIPAVVEEKCTGCGKCVEVCPVESLSLVSAGDPVNKKKKKAKLIERHCLGCGICVRSCSREALKLVERKVKVITPVDSVHKAVMMAIERGTLQHLIFDNQAMWNHRALAAIFGAILNLPPVKQILASEQVKSRYMAALLKRMNL
jgi:Fe-S-cluster-containing hydrogenase component 2